jgi:cytochrome c oxidase subunit 2
MRLMTGMGGIAAKASAVAAMVALSGAAALAQGLEVIGAPVPGGLNHQPASTSTMHELEWLDNALLILITIITLFVTALLVWVAIRYRAGRNPKPATFTHNTPLEIVWTVVPIIILIFIGSFSLPALRREQGFSDVKADLVIKATGNQWYWSYEYPDNGIAFDSFMLPREDLAANGYDDSLYLLATDTAVVLPVNKVVLMQVTAADVIHSWKIPAFGVMQDGVPGRIAQLWFKAEKEGIYFGQCSELCGKDHSYMPITVKVVSEEAYAKWVEGAKAGNLALASN